MSNIREQIQSLSPGALVEMFEFDLRPITGTNTPADIFLVHNGTNEKGTAVVWQGKEYQPWAVEAEGYGMSTQGTMPRPRVRLANPAGIITGLIAGKQDIVGAVVTRRQTYAMFLDAVNFVAGNPTADPGQHMPDEVYMVEKKTLDEPGKMIEWELASALDISKVTLPRRLVTATYCPWKYRGTECGYTSNSYFDAADNPVGSPNLDVCGKAVSSCKVRFGQYSPLNFGGFPAARLVRG